MIPSKYTVVLVQIATIIVTSLIAANADDVISAVEAFQIAGIGVGSVGVYFVPLLVGNLYALGKFLVAVAGAGLAAVPPIIDTENGGVGWTGTSILIVILALLNAALTAWGAKVRVDDAVTKLADNRVPDAAVEAADLKAVQVADATAGHR